MGCETKELEGKSMRPALDRFPLEAWDVIAAHVASPSSIQGLWSFAEAARALARLSCTCAPLYVAAAAGWACLGSHVAPTLHSALMTVMNPQSNWNEVLMGRYLCEELKPFRNQSASVRQRTSFGVKRVLSKIWSKDKLVERRVSFRTRSHLCMRCMQYATEGCVNHKGHACCAQAQNGCLMHPCFRR